MLTLKREKDKIILVNAPDTHQDTYNWAQVSRNWLDEIGFDYKTATKDDKIYQELSKHFKLVNLFAERIEVPNKPVFTDVPGTSKLIRNKEGSFIEISYRRKKKDGTQETKAMSPNTCYISIADREAFFSDVKLFGSVERGRFGDRYLLYKTDQAFGKWSVFMDKEYSRLSGIAFKTIRKVTKPAFTAEELYRRDSLWSTIIKWLTFLSNYRTSKLISFFKELEVSGFCKLNSTSEVLYDIDGIFIQYLYPKQKALDYVNIRNMLFKLKTDELKIVSAKLEEVALHVK